MDEARMRDRGAGLVPTSTGWFVVNARDAEWWRSDTRGARCSFDDEHGEPPVEHPQLGINLTVLDPGQATTYHAEANQEDFLVLAGTCLLVVEDEERPLGAWDLFHAPPWTAHAFVGTGDGPCALLMVGARTSPAVRYPVAAAAARHGASVAEATDDPARAYASAERFRRGRPASWARLPWAQP